MATASAISPHLVRSAISAAFFFLPVGVVALVYSFRCQKALDGGFEEQAAIEARRAYRWATVAFVIGICIYAFLVIAFLLLGAFT